MDKVRKNLQKIPKKLFKKSQKLCKLNKPTGEYIDSILIGINA